MNLPRLVAVSLAFLIALSARAALPLDQRPAKPDEWGYRPADGATVPLNPPTFTWVVPTGAATYAVEWSTDRSFPAGHTQRVDGVAWPRW